MYPYWFNWSSRFLHKACYQTEVLPLSLFLHVASKITILLFSPFFVGVKHECLSSERDLIKGCSCCCCSSPGLFHLAHFLYLSPVSHGLGRTGPLPSVASARETSGVSWNGALRGFVFYPLWWRWGTKRREFSFLQWICVSCRVCFPVECVYVTWRGIKSSD